jgi:demethylspheroidene O-methyltransferase
VAADAQHVRRAGGPEGSPPSLRDRWHALRDRLVASPSFQRWAASAPLIRRVARKRARALFDLCAGFVYSQVLLACVRLRVLELLREGPLAHTELAARTALSPQAARRLLDAAAALGLVEPRGADRFGLGQLGAALLGNPGVAAMIEHHALLYDDLRDPVALLRGTQGQTGLARFWGYARAPQPAALDGGEVAAYSALMSASQQLIAQDILDAYPLHRHRCLLDVGGGDGTFLAAAGTANPGLRLMLFDLPAVAQRAHARFAAAALEGRVSVSGGDFFADPLPQGADVVSLVRVVHDHDDARARAILHAVRRALPAGGTVLLAEPMSGTPGAEPVGDAYFGFYLLAMGSGRARTQAELTALLREAGFARVRAAATRQPLQTALLVAT